MDKRSLLTVLQQLGIRASKVNDRSGWVEFSCPMAQWKHKHGTDSTASAGARIEPNKVSMWHCFMCKSKGPISGLADELGRRRGIDYHGLVQALRAQEEVSSLSIVMGAFEDIAVNEPLPDPLDEAIYFGLRPAAWEIPEARDYLLSRNISRATSEAIEMVFDEKKHRILFPVRGRAGDLYGYSGRRVRPATKEEPKVRDYYGLPKRHMILGAHTWQPGLPMFIIEGLFGYAHHVEIGTPNIANVGAILGSVMTEEKAMLIRLEGAATYLMLDNDEAGEIGIFGRVDDDGKRHIGAVELLQHHVPLFVPPWPEGKIDPDQLTIEDVELLLHETDPWA